MILGKKTFLHDVFCSWRELTQSQKWLYVLYALVLETFILNIIRAIEIRIGLSFFTPVSDPFVILLAVIGSISVFINRIKGTDIVFILVVLLLYAFSYFLNQDTSKFAEENALRFLCVCLPLFVVGLTIDKKTSLTLFVLIAYVVFFLQILFLYVVGMGENEYGEEQEDLMGASYAFLPFVCLLVYNAFARGGLIHWIIAAISVFVLFSLGTRGPIICLAIFIALYVFFLGSFKHGVLIKVLTGVVVVFVFIFSYELTLAFSLLSEQLGLSSRVFDKILEGQLVNIDESSYRDYIWENVIAQLKAKGTLFDCNLYADHLFNVTDKQYVHNLELEILCDFGLMGGGIIIVVLLGIIFNAFRSAWKKEVCVLLAVYLSSSIMQLQLSNSFLECPEFWFFLGMCISLIRAKDPSIKANFLHRHVPSSNSSTKMISV